MTSELATTGLNLHNKHREDHGSPPLEWDEELEKSAAENAQSLVQNSDAPFVLNKKGDGSQSLLGYNIFEMEAEGQLTDLEIVDHAVRCWYEDGVNYIPETGKGGSYSQLLWKSTSKMALGVAKKVDELTGLLTAVVFGFYDPPGNYNGQFEANVAPMREEKKKAIIKSAKIGSGTAKSRPPPKPATPASASASAQNLEGSGEILDDPDTTRSVVQGSATEIRDIASAILDMVNATIEERKLDPFATANKITTITATITGGPSSDDGSRLQAALRGALATTGITDLTVTTGPSSDDPDNDQVTETSITVTITNDMVLGGLAELPPILEPQPSSKVEGGRDAGQAEIGVGQEAQKKVDEEPEGKIISQNQEKSSPDIAADISKKSDDDVPSTTNMAAEKSASEKPTAALPPAAEHKAEIKDKTPAEEAAPKRPPQPSAASAAEPAPASGALAAPAAAAAEPPPKMEIKFKVRVTVLTEEMKDLAAHVQNELRGKHGAPSLKIDQKLCDEAQAHAKSILADKSPENVGKEKSSSGKNVYEVTGTLTEPEEGIRAAVAHWYSKVSGHNWADPMASTPDSQIFSQVVWASSRRMGVAVETNNTNSVVVVVYAPPADFSTVKLYRSNVRPDVF